MALVSPAKTTLKSDSEGYTRLHITPLDADLLKVVVPAAVLPQARNISYHIIETFPDRRYGFVDLPIADADKLRKKLNGSTLKGTKVRIEQARPESIPQPETDAMEEAKTKKPKKEKRSKDKREKSKKRKRGAEVVEGVAIEDRKIKRGWTVTESDKIQEKRKEKSKKSKDGDGKSEKKEKKREVKSKYTDSPECLFKQKLPEVPSTKKTEEDVDDEPKRKKKRNDRLVVVHEFEKTDKYPTFLKSTTDSTAPKPLTFEDGKGWVDDEGNVVEGAKSKRPAFSSKFKASKKEAPKPVPDEDDDTSSSGSSSESEADEEAEVAITSNPSQKVAVKATAVAKKPTPVPEEDDTSSSGSSSDDEPVHVSAPAKAKPTQETESKSKRTQDDDETSSSGSSSNVDDEIAAPARREESKLKLDTQPLTSPVSALKNDSSRPKSSSSATSLTIKIPPITPAPTQVHPLEALYKRPAGADADATNGGGFSFFGNEDDIEDDDTNPAPSGSQVPMTPFSRQDYDFRNLRSAAPTPDTAHPSRSYNLWSRSATGEDTLEEEGEEQEAGDDVVMAEATASKAADKAASNSEFQNWFWEHRGDLNRSWKKRRKTASKEKRNRENRARAARAI
ncbi:putative RRM domain-containing protein [Seiridium cardinale]